jgi:hypothetical protein
MILNLTIFRVFIMIFIVISSFGIQLVEQKIIAQPVVPQYLIINGNVTLMRGEPHHQLECEYPFYKYTALAGTSRHLIFSAKILNDSRIFVDNPAISSPHLSPTYPATGSWTLRDLGDPFAKTPENVTYYMHGKINSSSSLSEPGKHNFSINGFTNYIGDL